MRRLNGWVSGGQSSNFPRRRLFQSLELSEVARAVPLYHDSGRWLNDDAGLARDVFVMGFNPGDAVFDVPEIQRQVEALRRPDTILVDAASRPEFGRLYPGRLIEIEQ